MIMKHELLIVIKQKADGSLYVNEWYQDSTLTYYYGEAGKIVHRSSDNKWKTVLFL